VSQSLFVALWAHSDESAPWKVHDELCALGELVLGAIEKEHRFDGWQMATRGFAGSLDGDIFDNDDFWAM
jgi:hypothetical protein